MQVRFTKVASHCNVFVLSKKRFELYKEKTCLLMKFLSRLHLDIFLYIRPLFTTYNITLDDQSQVQKGYK